MTPRRRRSWVNWTKVLELPVRIGHARLARAASSSPVSDPGSRDHERRLSSSSPSRTVAWSLQTSLAAWRPGARFRARSRKSRVTGSAMLPKSSWLPGCLAMSGGRFTVRNGLAREHELIWGRGGGQWILVGNWTFFVRKTT